MTESFIKVRQNALKAATKGYDRLIIEHEFHAGKVISIFSKIWMI